MTDRPADAWRREIQRSPFWDCCSWDSRGMYLRSRYKADTMMRPPKNAGGVGTTGTPVICGDHPGTHRRVWPEAQHPCSRRNQAFPRLPKPTGVDNRGPCSSGLGSGSRAGYYGMCHSSVRASPCPKGAGAPRCSHYLPWEWCTLQGTGHTLQVVASRALPAWFRIICSSGVTVTKRQQAVSILFPASGCVLCSSAARLRVVLLSPPLVSRFSCFCPTSRQIRPGQVRSLQANAFSLWTLIRVK